MSQMSTVSYLWARGDMGQTALARALGLTTGSITPLVDRTESTGWVGRVPDTRDRRRTLVRVTTRGKEFIDDVANQFGQSMIAIFRPRI